MGEGSPIPAVAPDTGLRAAWGHHTFEDLTKFFPAWMAVDGRRGGTWDSLDIFHSFGDDPFPWLALDLTQSHSVSGQKREPRGTFILPKDENTLSFFYIYLLF